MIRVLQALILSLVCLSFSACQSGDPGVPQAISDGQMIGQGSNGGIITMRVGETFNVSLPSNRSTGYSWQLDDSYQPVLKQGAGTDQGMQANAHVADEPVSTTGLVGAPGVQTWTFTAVEPGQTELRLNYTRVWEEGKPPSQVFELTVAVTK